MLRAVTHRDVLSSHMRDKKNVFLFGAKERSETRNITPWDLIPPTGGMHSHVATWRRIPCTEQALNLLKGNEARWLRLSLFDNHIVYNHSKAYQPPRYRSNSPTSTHYTTPILALEHCMHSYE